MRKLNKRGAADEQSSVIRWVIAGLILVIAVAVIWLYIWPSIKAYKPYIPAESLANVVQACSLYCTQADKTSFCTRKNTVSGMEISDDMNLINNKIYPNSNICGTDGVNCPDQTAYITLKGNNVQAFKVTCNELNKAGLGVDVCGQFSC